MRIIKINIQKQDDSANIFNKFKYPVYVLNPFMLSLKRRIISKKLHNYLNERFLCLHIRDIYMKNQTFKRKEPLMHKLFLNYKKIFFEFKIN